LATKLFICFPTFVSLPSFFSFHEWKILLWFTNAMEREALVELFFLSHIQMGKNITNPIILGTWLSFFHTISHLGNTHHYLTRNFRHLNFKGTLIWNRFAWNLKYSNNGTYTLVYIKELVEQEDANIVTFQRAIELQCWKEKPLCLIGNSKVFLVPQNFNFLIKLSLILNSHTKVFFSIRVLQSQHPNEKPLT